MPVLALALLVATASRFEGAPVHVLHVPPGAHVRPVFTHPTRTLEALVHRAGAIAGINGGYFNHSDGRSVSHVWVAGHEVADPEHNRALVTNPALAPVLDRILRKRAGWRASADGRWSILPQDAGVPWDGLQAGPALLPGYDPVGEGFVLVDRRGRPTRDGIGTTARAARSALGLDARGGLLLVGVGQPGLALPALARLLRAQGAVAALNLDGGSSTGLAWTEGGRLRVDHGGHGSAPIASALVVVP